MAAARCALGRIPERNNRRTSRNATGNGLRSSLRVEDKILVQASRRDCHAEQRPHRLGQSLRRQDNPHVCFVGIDICEDAYLNRGLGTEALRLWVNHIFSTSDVHKIGLETWSFNPRMIRVAEKAGFVREGCQREIRQWQGEWLDLVQFGILREEWQEEQGARTSTQDPRVWRRSLMPERQGTTTIYETTSFRTTMFAQFYQAVSSPIEQTDEPLRILDLGCGTGLELEALLQRAPNAAITGVDLAEDMLDQLRARYAAHMDQITLVVDSYLTMPLGTQAYDYVLSTLSMHHVLHDTQARAVQENPRRAETGRQIHRGGFRGPCRAGAVVPRRIPRGCRRPIAGRRRDSTTLTFLFPSRRREPCCWRPGSRTFEVIWQKDPEVSGTSPSMSSPRERSCMSHNRLCETQARCEGQ